MNTTAEPNECLAKACVLLLMECDKCGEEVSRTIANLIVLAWEPGVLLLWFVVEMYKTHKYTTRYASIHGYRNKLVLKSSSTEETNGPHDKKVSKKKGKYKYIKK